MTNVPDGPAAAPPRPAPPAPAVATRARVAFVDVARALAVLLMILGHSLNVLLAPEYQQGSGFRAFLFLRGLTSGTFLLLSGFAFTIASSRYWESHLRPSRRALRRVRRFAFFALLGYTLRFPVDKFEHLLYLTPARWQYFLTVDILQCIGVTLLALQALVVLARTPRRFAIAAGGLAAAAVLITPAAWSVDWPRYLPLSVAAYLSPGTGSLFPLLPWSGFMLLGAALGYGYVRAWPADPQAFARRVLLPAGGGMIALGLLLHQLPYNPLGVREFWTTSPNFFLIRAGCVLLILAGLSHATRSPLHLPRVTAALAQESLLIYFIHLVVLYGSAWNLGLQHLLPAPFSPLPALAWVGMMLLSMSALAWGWHWTKRRHPWVAVGCRATVAVLFWLSIR